MKAQHGGSTFAVLSAENLNCSAAQEILYEPKTCLTNLHYLSSCSLHSPCMCKYRCELRVRAQIISAQKQWDIMRHDNHWRPLHT